MLVEGAGGGTAVLGDGEAPPGDPLAFLNPGTFLSDLGSLSRAPEGGGRIEGMVSSPDGWSGFLEGEGVLVVHNPLFDPVLHEASRLALEEGVFLPAYDSSYSHLDPLRRPARLELAGGADFRGLVLTDSIGAVFGTSRIVGALVTLQRHRLELRSWGRLEIRYSKTVLEKVSRGPLVHPVYLKSLPGTAERFARLEANAVPVPP